MKKNILTLVMASIFLLTIMLSFVTTANGVFDDVNHNQNDIFNISNVNATAGNFTGNVTASFYFGDGSQLTGIAGGGGGNPFDQSLNTTDDVQFNNVTITGFFRGLFNWTSVSSFLTFDGSSLDFNDTSFNSTYDSRYLRLSGTNADQNIDVSPFNLTASFGKFTNILSNDWTNVTITESQITDLQNYAVNNTVGWTLNFTNIFSDDWSNITLIKSQLLNSGTLGFDWVDSEISDILTINSSGNVTWSALSAFPTTCTSSQFISALGDTITCGAISIAISQITDLIDASVNTSNFWDNLDTPTDITGLNSSNINDIYLFNTGDVGAGAYTFTLGSGDDFVINGTTTDDGEIKLTAGGGDVSIKSLNNAIVLNATTIQLQGPSGFTTAGFVRNTVQGILSGGNQVEGLFNSSSWNRSSTNIFLANIADMVGIGTATPGQRLEVNGSVALTLDNDKLFFGTAEDISITYNGSQTLFTNEVGSGAWTFGSGDFGIGTLVPTDKFNVVGTSNFTANMTVGDCIIFTSGGAICSG